MPSAARLRASDATANTHPPWPACAAARPAPAIGNHMRTVRQTIESWVLDNAQLPVGSNAGGVAGAIDANGDTIYVYPEIAGYFLQWLAWLRAQDAPAAGLVRRAVPCQRWLRSWIDRTGPPQTRLHLQFHAQDWRNSGLFFFDLAMVLRGLAAAVELDLLCADQRLIGGLVRHLSTLVADDGMFVACRATSPTAPLPARWSTRRGAFLAKAAAGIVSAAQVLRNRPDRGRRHARREHQTLPRATS